MPLALTPVRRAALAVGVPLILVSAVWNGVSLAALTGRATVTTTTSYDVQGTHFALFAGGGGVTVTQSPDAQVHVTARVRYGFGSPNMAESVDSAGLHIDSHCAWYADACSIDLDVSVPAAVALDVETGGGDLRVTGLTAETRLVSGGGDVTATDMSGRLTLMSGGGDVRGVRLSSAQVSAESSGGNVDVRFAAPPTSVDAHSSGGDVTVHVPLGQSYRIEASTGGGDVHVTVPRDDLSVRVLTARSSGGDVTVVPDGVAR